MRILVMAAGAAVLVAVATGCAGSGHMVQSTPTVASFPFDPAAAATESGSLPGVGLAGSPAAAPTTGSTGTRAALGTGSASTAGTGSPAGVDGDAGSIPAAGASASADGSASAENSAQVAADLGPIEADLSGIDAGASQADSDLARGDYYQSQDDSGS